MEAEIAKDAIYLIILVYATFMHFKWKYAKKQNHILKVQYNSVQNHIKRLEYKNVELEVKLFDRISEFNSLKKSEKNALKLVEENSKTYKQKLDFAIANTPKFKVNDVVDNVTVLDVDVKIKSNAIILLKSITAGFFCGYTKALETFYNEAENNKCFSYKIQSNQSHLGQKLEKEWLSEDELIELKKSKTTKRKK